MADSDIIEPTFTITGAARRAIGVLRGMYDAQFPDNPASVLSVAWGYTVGSDWASGGLIMNFYPRSQEREVADGVRVVSGVPLVYFVTERLHPLFDRKVLDHTDSQGFFLRDP